MEQELEINKDHVAPVVLGTMPMWVFFKEGSEMSNVITSHMKMKKTIDFQLDGFETNFMTKFATMTICSSRY